MIAVTGVLTAIAANDGGWRHAVGIFVMLAIISLIGVFVAERAARGRSLL